MLLKIAFRNLLRNKRRSGIVLGSVIVGIISLILMDGLMNGMLSQMLFNQVRIHTAHIQIHKNGFNKNKTIKNSFSNYEELEDKIKSNPEIKSYSKRLKSFGLISSAMNSSGVMINGVEFENESQVSILESSITEGSYLSGNKREIIIGKRLAEKLEVSIDDKIVLMSNTPDGKVASELFRIVGIFSTASSDFDKTTIFVGLKKLQSMLEIGNNISEIAIITDNRKTVEIVKNSLKSAAGDYYEVLSYNDLLPFLVMQLDMYKQMMAIINLIVGIALIFGIINAMLMSVFERINEIGVLMSIGMKNKKIFIMILLESLSLGIVGTIAGVILGLAIHFSLAGGVDLSLFSESLESFGIGAVIYPTLSFEGIMSMIFTIPIITVIAAIYPAYKAVKLEPVSAIRYV